MRAPSLVLSAIAIAAPTVLAHGEWGHCGAIDVEIVGDHATHYVALGPRDAGAIEVLVYAEANGWPHLQRGGQYVWFGKWQFDECREIGPEHPGLDPDRLIF